MMLTRRRTALAAFALVASALIASTVLVSCSDGEDAGTAPGDTTDPSTSGGVTSATELGASGTLFQPPPPAAGFTLTDEHGEPVSLSDFRGKVVAVYFGYTHCPDICPLTLGTYKAALERLPSEVSDQVDVLLVSVDPERDTPEVVARYTDLFGERFIGVTGSLDEVDDVLEAWDIQVTRGEPDEIGAYAVTHPAASWIVDQQGRLRVKVAHMTGTDALAADLQTIVEEGTE